MAELNLHRPMHQSHTHASPQLRAVVNYNAFYPAFDGLIRTSMCHRPRTPKFMILAFSSGPSPSTLAQ